MAVAAPAKPKRSRSRSRSAPKARPQPAQPKSNLTVEEAINQTIKAINGNADSVLLSEEAHKLVNRFRGSNPDALIDYFEGHAISLIREQLQLRLANKRRSNQARSIFEDTSPGDKRTEVNPFEREYATEGNIWKSTGEMLKTDWLFVADQYRYSEKVNRFQALCAERIAAKLPDNQTRTKEVFSPEDIKQLERNTRRKAGL